MLKYLCFIILGILIYILLNSKDSFNVGIPGINEVCDDASLCDVPFACIEWNTSKMCREREFWIRKMPFFSAGNKLLINTIDLPRELDRDTQTDYNKIETFILSVLKYYYDKNLRHPPIYIGTHLLYMGISKSNIEVYVFIINEKIYFFKFKVPENRWLVSINHGQGDRAPIPILYIGSPLPAIFEIHTPSMRNPYLTITGTNSVSVYLYLKPGNVSDNSLRITRDIAISYIKSIKELYALRSCAISSDGAFYNLSEFITINAEAFKNLSSDAPPDTMTINTSGMQMCETVNSVYLSNLNQVSDGNYDRNLLNMSDVHRSQGVNIPTLQYKTTPLNYIKNLGSGTFGYVYVASNIPITQFSSTSNTGYAGIAVVFKTYKSLPGKSSISGQNDPEIQIIRDINRIEDGLDNCYILGELVNASILLTNTGDNIAIMQYMDDNLYNFVKNTNYNYAIITSDLAFRMSKRLMQLLLCVHNAGYEYLDLKLQNLLYRCYKDNKLLISFGDLGSLSPVQISGEKNPGQMRSRERPSPITYGPIEFILSMRKMYTPHDDPDIFNISKVVVYTYGLTILELYLEKVMGFTQPDPDIQTQKDSFYLNPVGYKLFVINTNPHFSNPIDFESLITIEYMSKGSKSFYQKTSEALEKHILNIEKYKTRDKTREINFIVDLLRRIFVPPETRITLEEIEVLFTQFNSPEEGEPPEPEPEPCSQYNDNETQCNRQMNCQYNSDSRLCIDI
jgi:serine/threonine protein kinase